MKFLGVRVTDPHIQRLIWRFLKAGVMEQGTWEPTETGTPQGSLISPRLKAERHQDVKKLMKTIQAKLTGHYRYYGITDIAERCLYTNFRSPKRYLNG